MASLKVHYGAYKLSFLRKGKFEFYYIETIFVLEHARCLPEESSIHCEIILS
jgi:hypothetical protein